MYYYGIAVLIGIITWLWRRDWTLSILLAYVFMVVVKTILIRRIGALRYEFTPFWSYSEPALRRQIVANIIMFIPIGLLGAKMSNWKILPGAVLLSVMIELTQLVTHRGLFEFDDMIHNTLGAVIGFSVYMIGRTIWRHLRNYGEE